MENIIQVAVIGAGPAGIYAAEALLKKLENVQITIIDALPTPFGLVRSGVAPDHYKIKEVSRVFEKTLSNERVTYLGNVLVDQDITIPELQEYFNIIILCHGTTKDRRLGIEGEDTYGAYPATDFVGWYNSHPLFQDKTFNLDSSDCAVIIGQGNVALDLARILLKDPKDLEHTDISELALAKLRTSKVKTVYLVGRRGPLQIACTDKELSEFADIENLGIHLRDEDFNLAEEEKLWISEAPKGTRKNYEILKSFQEKNSVKEKNLHILFNLSPLQVLGEKSVEKIIFSKNKLEGPLDSRKAVATKETIEINCSTLFKSVGYLGTGLKGLPFSQGKGTYPNQEGAVLGEDGTPLPGIYTSGWIKRGPSGVIGTNKQDSAETIEKIILDLAKLNLSAKAGYLSLQEYLEKKGNRFTTYSDWKVLDQLEIETGKNLSKCRNKFSNLKDMLSSL